MDMLCGATHAWKLPPPVAIHYMAQFALLLAYPVVILDNLLQDQFMAVMLKHTVLIGVMGLMYRWETRHLPDSLRVPAYAFLPIAFLMPVTYALFTPLALLTLDSGSWETRSVTASAGAGAVDAAGGRRRAAGTGGGGGDLTPRREDGRARQAARGAAWTTETGACDSPVCSRSDR